MSQAEKEEEADDKSGVSLVPTTTTATGLTGQGTETGKVKVSPRSPRTQETTEEDIESDLMSPEEVRQLQEAMASKNDDEIMDQLVDPPLTCVEHFRDDILRLLDTQFFQVVGILVLIGVIIDGAVFFFFLMGWQNLCRPRTDCNPRNDIYNISVQILNGFFTYTGIVSLPWRCTNFLHVSGWHCPRRQNKPGYDLYGLPTMDIWFHLSRKQRIYILIPLILNCVFQFINQSMRIIYWNYELQDELPGVIFVNVFFASSFLSGFVGGSLLVYFSHLKRQEHPGKFGPGLKELVQEFWGKHVRRKEATDDEDGEGGDKEEEEQPQPLPARFDHPDPTRADNKWEATKLDRAEMRLWAL